LFSRKYLRGPHAILVARPTPTRGLALGRALNLTVVVVSLTVLAVPMMIIGLLIRLTSKGPALFQQQRIGYRGQPFTMYKFRTMRTGDPRVAGIGTFLRKTSFDELPQLLNVLLGDMSLVGPRPCLEWEARLFPSEFQPRFSVRPGITGLWQVSGRYTVSTLEMLDLDLAYVRTRSTAGDLSILLRTVPSMLLDHSSASGPNGS
jgi:lipopolysaccharide/colanic/teichoic acid biosynthesis glycosyltransferase